MSDEVKSSGFSDKFQKKGRASDLKKKEKSSRSGFSAQFGSENSSVIEEGEDFGECIYDKERKEYFKYSVRIVLREKEMPDGRKKKVRVKKKKKIFLTSQQVEEEKKAFLLAQRNESSSKKTKKKKQHDSYSDMLRARMGKYVYTVRGQDRGWDAWHIVLVKPKLLDQFKKKIMTGSIDVADYGEVLYSGWGKDPSEDVLKKIEEEFGG